MRIEGQKAIERAEAEGLLIHAKDGRRDISLEEARACVDEVYVETLKVSVKQGAPSWLGKLAEEEVRACTLAYEARTRELFLDRFPDVTFRHTIDMRTDAPVDIFVSGVDMKDSSASVHELREYTDECLAKAYEEAGGERKEKGKKGKAK